MAMATVMEPVILMVAAAFLLLEELELATATAAILKLNHPADPPCPGRSLTNCLFQVCLS